MFGRSPQHPGPSLAIAMAVAAIGGSCGSLFWRSAVEVDSAHWLNDNTVIEVLVHYREKDPFPPIAVTHTLKKEYRTEFVVRSVRGTQLSEESGAPRSSIEGRAIGGLAPLGEWLVTARRRNPERARTEELVLVSPAKGEVDRIPLGLRGQETVVGIIASPDRGRVLIHVRGPEVSRLLLAGSVAELRGLAQHAPGTLRDPGLNLPGAEASVAWAPDSTGVYALSEGHLVFWTGRRRHTPTTFPRCFVPETEGGRLSPDGRRFFRADAAEAASIRPVPNFTRLSQIPMVTRVREIGTGCPE